MELRKVKEIYNYKGNMWYIHPYVSCGKIVRKDIFKVNKNNYRPGWGCYTFEHPYGKGVYFSRRNGEPIEDENTEINRDNIRVFTTRAEAKEALDDFEKQHAYKISESVRREIERLEREKADIEAQIAKLKETGEKAFKNLSTTFSK